MRLPNSFAFAMVVGRAVTAIQGIFTYAKFRCSGRSAETALGSMLVPFANIAIGPSMQCVFGPVALCPSMKIDGSAFLVVMAESGTLRHMRICVYNAFVRAFYLALIV